VTAVLALAILSAGAWVYLALGRGFFWRMRERDDASPAIPQARHWPSVTAIVPARDESEIIERSIGSLLRQKYAGPFNVIVVDDRSRDDTASRARALDGSERLTVLSGMPRPHGWTGKLWAMQQGVARATAEAVPEFFWFTDADIEHAPDTLSSLVVHAQTGYALVSLMARLRCEALVEKAFIPAFIFFFAMLYPFAWVNKKGRTAAAAGGCMLVQRVALEAAGGLAAIRNGIIDDCALARLLKIRGSIWLGLTDRSVSLRAYPEIPDIHRMISRSAYAQLGYSPLVLAGTIVAMLAVFVAPALLALFAQGLPQILGALAWLIMALLFQPVLRFYRLSALWGIGLPAMAAFYTAFTFDSAWQHWRGRGGMWKGRAQAMPS